MYLDNERQYLSLNQKIRAIVKKNHNHGDVILQRKVNSARRRLDPMVTNGCLYAFIYLIEIVTP